jgi:aldehyde dehydrogenase (NAD+)
MIDSPWDYAPAPESRDIANLRPSYRMFVDGEFVDGVGEPLKSINPATEELLAEVSSAAESDVDNAVRAARRAFERTWSTMPGRERAKYLFRIARLIQERARELAVLESLDNGKPIKESRDADIPTAAAHFFHHAGWADKLGYAGYGPDPRPLGVAGQVIPWNFPLLMLAWKIAPALACGNTVVLKPAETTPLTALVFAEICQQAGLPPGVVNILPGAGDIGAALVAHPGIDKVAFTGSTEVGKQIQRSVAGSGKKLRARGGPDRARPGGQSGGRGHHPGRPDRRGQRPVARGAAGRGRGDPRPAAGAGGSGRGLLRLAAAAQARRCAHQRRAA